MKQTRVVNIKKSDHDVYCGRKPGGSDWGNPYHIGKHGTREEVIEKFRHHLVEQIRLGLRTWKQLKSLHGKRLGCYCKPLPCHADIIREYADLAHSSLSENKFLEAVGLTAKETKMGKMLQSRIEVARESSEAANDVLKDKQEEYRFLLEDEASQSDLKAAALDVKAATEDYDEAISEYKELVSEDDEDDVEDDENGDDPDDDENDDDGDVIQFTPKAPKATVPPPTSRPKRITKKENNMATRRPSKQVEEAVVETQSNGISPEDMQAIIAGVAAAMQAQQQTAPPAAAAPQQQAAPPPQAEWQKDLRTTSSNRKYVDVKRLNNARDGYDVVASYPVEEDNDQLFELVQDANPIARLRAKDNVSGVVVQTRIEKNGRFVMSINGPATEELMQYFNGGPLPKKDGQTQSVVPQKSEATGNGNGETLTRPTRKTAAKIETNGRTTRPGRTNRKARTATPTNIENLIRQFDDEGFSPEEILTLVLDEEEGKGTSIQFVNEVLETELA